MITGEKTEEYREISHWITSRLINKDGTPRTYEYVEFANGYSKTARRFRVKYEGFEKVASVNKTYSNNLTVKQDKEVFAIKLGEILP